MSCSSAAQATEWASSVGGARRAWIELTFTMARSAGGSSRPASSIIRRATIWLSRRLATTFCASAASSPSASGFSGSEATSRRLAFTSTSMPS